MGSSSQINNSSLQISIPFLKDALGKGFEIEKFSVRSGSNLSDNFMSLIYSVDVNCKDINTGLNVTRYLLLKCYPQHPSRQQLSNKSNMFFKELEIYRSWIPELMRFQTEILRLDKPTKLPFAPFVYGKCIDYSSTAENTEKQGGILNSLDNCIILDDLRKTGGFRMIDRREVMEIEHINLLMLELAKIHALSWAYKSQVENDLKAKFNCLAGGFLQSDEGLLAKLLEQNFHEAQRTVAGVLGDGNYLSNALLQFRGKVNTVLDVLFHRKDEEVLDTIFRIKPEAKGNDSSEFGSWRVISHGDCWSNNMLFRYDPRTQKPVEIVLVDFQMMRETYLTTDLVYAIYVCTDSDFRKRYLDEILKLYFDNFISFCKTFKTAPFPGFTFDELKYRFHRFKLVGLLDAIFLLPALLKDETVGKELNLENMEQDKEISEMLSEISKSAGVNEVYSKRLISLLRELYEDGVI